MSRNIHSNPKLYIEDILIPSCGSANISFSGSNQLIKFSATLTNPDMEEAALFGKRISYYLNYGSDDGVPIFRGYITSVNASDTQVKINAVDVRGYLTVDSSEITLTEKNNYDGYTLGQFLKSYIDNFININKTYIGTDNINDTLPVVTLSGVRGTFKAYDLVTNTLKKAVDTEDDNEPLDYNISIMNDIEDSHIVFVKKKPLNSTPSFNLSRTNGIISLSYKERPRKFVAKMKDRSFTYGSNPSGPFNIKIPQTKEEVSPEDLRETARQTILKELQNTTELTIKASKGHYANIGSIVNLNVPKLELSGPQRIVGKKISVSSGGVDLSLMLNKEPVTLSQYIDIK